jgi:hypothetical protein
MLTVNMTAITYVGGGKQGLGGCISIPGDIHSMLLRTISFSQGPRKRYPSSPYHHMKGESHLGSAHVLFHTLLCLFDLCSSHHPNHSGHPGASHVFVPPSRQSIHEHLNGAMAFLLLSSMTQGTRGLAGLYPGVVCSYTCPYPTVSDDGFN